MYDVFLGIHTGACASAVIGSANLSFEYVPSL